MTGRGPFVGVGNLHFLVGAAVPCCSPRRVWYIRRRDRLRRVMFSGDPTDGCAADDFHLRLCAHPYLVLWSRLALTNRAGWQLLAEGALRGWAHAPASFRTRPTGCTGCHVDAAISPAPGSPPTPRGPARAGVSAMEDRLSRVDPPDGKAGGWWEWTPSSATGHCSRRGDMISRRDPNFHASDLRERVREKALPAGGPPRAHSGGGPRALSLKAVRALGSPSPAGAILLRTPKRVVALLEWLAARRALRVRSMFWSTRLRHSDTRADEKVVAGGCCPVTTRLSPFDPSCGTGRGPRISSFEYKYRSTPAARRATVTTSPAPDRGALVCGSTRRPTARTALRVGRSP